jgi:iron complex outermembrane receptor protein
VLPQVYVTRLNSIEGVQTQGAEIDINALVTPDFLVNIGYAYTEATITGFKNAACYTVTGSPNGGFNAECIIKNPAYGNANTNDVSGGKMPFAPRNKLSLGMRYSFPLLGFKANINGNYNYQSSMIANLNQDPSLFIAGREVINMGFGLRENRDRYGMTFTVNNLLDERYLSNRSFNNVITLNAGPSTARTVTANTSTWTPLRSSFRYFTARFDVKF